MKLAIVGKGGSGKSTLSWLLAKQASENGKQVLAIDADYNMDFAHNFGWENISETNFLNQAEPDFYRYQGLTEKDYYVDLPAKDNLKPFSFTPHDSFTQKYAQTLPTDTNIHLMIAGPHHEDLLYGHRCSHAYITSLKYYLPLLQKPEDSLVIIDSVAGTDMVSYGLYLGVDAMIVVVEPHPNSVGVFRQIQVLAQEFDIPIFAVINKAVNTSKIADFKDEYKDIIFAELPIDTALLSYDYALLNSETKNQVAGIVRQLSNHPFDPKGQWQRHVTWKKKYDQQLKESQNKSFTFVKK